ncbi:unnamed protein product [marine sediment metagenome]|uniref:Uncharacterized protein n=1 Tax=marine sediment metagenome TaxID=412755 RepID=X0VYX1_9ZZZZ
MTDAYVKLAVSVDKFIEFLNNDAGTVTIDWVVLTAGVLVLAITVVYEIYISGASILVSDINSTIDNMTTNVLIPDIDCCG